MWHSFYTRKALTIHCRIYTNDCPHLCSMRNKCFVTQSAINLHLRFTLVTNHTHVQHVRNLSLSGGILCGLLWYSLVKRALCVRSVGRHSLGRSVWRDTLNCTVVRNLSTVIVVGVSLWNVIWKDILEDCIKYSSNLKYSSLVGCNHATTSHSNRPEFSQHCSSHANCLKLI